MKASLLVRRGATVAVILVAVLIATTVALLAAVDAGYGRSLLIHYAASRLGRPVEVMGTLRAHIYSRHPEVVAYGVTIGNPPWMPAGVTAEIGRLKMIVTLPGSGRTSGIERLELQDSKFHLRRDATGHANWQRNDPDKPR